MIKFVYFTELFSFKFTFNEKFNYLFNHEELFCNLIRISLKLKIFLCQKTHRDIYLNMCDISFVSYQTICN